MPPVQRLPILEQRASEGLPASEKGRSDLAGSREREKVLVNRDSEEGVDRPPQNGLILSSQEF